MPLFITYASYSSSGIKGLLDKPADRGDALKKMIKQGGGKLIELYMTTGEHDVVMIWEAPDGEDAVAMGMAASASGAVSGLTTVRAWKSADFKNVVKKAAGLQNVYKPPGN